MKKGIFTHVKRALGAMELIVETSPLSPEDIEELEQLIKEIAPEAHQCYYNARNLAIQSDGKYRYCEGAIWQGNANVQHAWNRIGSSIVDITPDKSGEPFCLSSLRGGWRYAGIEFPLEAVEQKDEEIGGVKGSDTDLTPNDSNLRLLEPHQQKEANLAVLAKFQHGKL